MLVRSFKNLELLLGVVQLVDHQVFNVAKTLDHLGLHLSCFEFLDHFFHVVVFSNEIFLLLGVQLCLNSLLMLLPH